MWRLGEFAQEARLLIVYVGYQTCSSSLVADTRLSAGGGARGTRTFFLVRSVSRSGTHSADGFSRSRSVI